MNNDKELVQEDIIDLSQANNGVLNETLMGVFGDNVFFPKKIKGTRSEVDKFLRALSKEKNYMSSYKKYGLSDKRTYDNKYKLDKAVQDFEKETNLKWPFK